MEVNMLEQEIRQSFKGLNFPPRKIKTVVTKPRASATHSNFPYIERITIDPNIHFGKPVVKGTRITVQSVLELLNEGIAFDQIIKDYYPDLVEEDIQACLQYAISLIGAGEIQISSVST
jgi:uncharacterized protein (DUF433 family)